ncbi:RNA pseudouridylate synthase domain-containing protein 2-like isoform X2 [Xenopus laevis]|uniref:Pseudouridylate synthase RPUSD2 n=1 Tax=Xenopus laevis TaxID=8355 RepID=A0A8J1LKU9_XENLA|nr:RNA pseudouridylate synthase domain-containing protein 2-like isoform X2 [Xenopus laevis]
MCACSGVLQRGTAHDPGRESQWEDRHAGKNASPTLHYQRKRINRAATRKHTEGMIRAQSARRLVTLDCRSLAALMSEGSLKRKEPNGEPEEGTRKRRHKKHKGAGDGDRFVPPPVKRKVGVSFGDEHFRETESYLENGLRKVRPYYFDFETYCKGRWVGKSLLEVFAKEFRAEPLEYYEQAAQAGRLRLNEVLVRDLNVVLKNNDFLRNTVHRHEPPVTAQLLRILAENDEMVVVDKPPSLPVHPCGRFRHNTVIFILGKEYNLKELHTIHRLDRMTSGVLMFAKTLDVSKKIDEQVRQRQLEKEYVCRVCGEFPEEEVTCEEPIFVVSYKIGVCRVDPKGKPCKTVFQRLSYNGKTSVVKCFPYTGRTHQIRVHLQYLGHPIVNDPIYNTEAWGPNRGKGGEVNRTDDELLWALVEVHKSKQSLDILDISEEDLQPIVGNVGLKSSTEPVQKEPRVPADPQLKDEPQQLTLTENVSFEKTDGSAACRSTEEPRQDSRDSLCGECKIVRADPSPTDLVMYLHALHYKGAEFDFSSEMPDWAQDDWQED